MFSGGKRKRLREAIDRPLRTIAMAKAGLLRDAGELERTLSTAGPQIQQLRRDLAEADVRKVFEEWWRTEGLVLEPLWEDGLVDQRKLRQELWTWLHDGSLTGGEGREGSAHRANPTAARRLARPVAFPDLRNSSYVYVETVRAVLPENADTFPVVAELADRLIEARGYGFGGVVLDDRGQTVSPDWLCASSVHIAAPTIAAGGTIAHRALRLPAALDLGARDGRNLSNWGGTAPQGLVTPHDQLFVGNLADGWLEMVEVGGSVCSLDASRDGQRLAVLEWWGGVGAVSLVDVHTGQRRLLTTLDRISGSEQIRFSADGLWLLVPRWRQPCLVHATTGRLLELPLEGAVAWWPTRAPSTLMVLEQARIGYPCLVAYDLEEARVEALSDVRLPEQPDLAESRRVVSDLEVSPDGTHALCMTMFGPPAAYQEQHGGRYRVCLMDIEHSHVEMLHAPFVDEQMFLEREHRAARWLGDAPTSTVCLAASLEQQLREPSNELAERNFTNVAEDARHFAVLGMQAMMGAPDDPQTTDPHRLRPEVMRALLAIQRFSPDMMSDMQPWIDQVTGFYGMLGSTRTIGPLAADGWSKVRDSWARIRASEGSSIDWEADRYVDVRS